MSVLAAGMLKVEFIKPDTEYCPRGSAGSSQSAVAGLVTGVICANAEPGHTVPDSVSLTTGPLTLAVQVVPEMASFPKNVVARMVEVTPPSPPRGRHAELAVRSNA